VVAIEGLRQARAWLERLAGSDSFMVRDAARGLIREGDAKSQSGGGSSAGERWYPET
jgi:hypothetical protein